MNLEDKIKWLLATYPEVRKSNTELYIRLLETAYLQRTTLELPEEIKDIIRQYKPEAVTRKRRDIIKGTKEQYAEEERYRQEYRR